METIEYGLIIAGILALALASGVVLWSTESWELIALGLIILAGIYITR